MEGNPYIKSTRQMRTQGDTTQKKSKQSTKKNPGKDLMQRGLMGTK